MNAPGKDGGGGARHVAFSRTLWQLHVVGSGAVLASFRTEDEAKAGKARCSVPVKIVPVDAVDTQIGTWNKAAIFLDSGTRGQ